MIPKWLYYFNHYLMLVSLGLLLLLIVLELLILPFWKHMSYEFIAGSYTFVCWAFPILLVLFIVSSGVVVNGFSQHRIERKDKKEN